MTSEAIEESFPLSPMQQGMLFHGIYAPRSRSYVRQVVCALHEDIDVGALRQAWLHIVDRHPVLRTSFRWKGLDAPVQDVHRTVAVPWKERDLRGCSAAEQEARLTAFLAADRERGFAFDEAPLIRLALLRLGPADDRLIWTFHHILLDGRTRLALTREIFAAYEEIRRGEERPQQRSCSYRSHVEWLGKQDPVPAQAFWRRTLAGFATPTSLVVDRAPVADLDEDDHAQQAIRLSARSTTTMLALARAADVTPNTLLMGAWSVLLSRYSGDEDVVFGTTRSVRSTIPNEHRGIAGLLINTLPMRVRVPGAMTALTMLQEIRAQWIAVRTHEHTALAMVHECTEVAAGRPLFESLVLFENYREDSVLRAQGGAWEQREFSVRGRGNPVPLTVTGSLDGVLDVEIGYRRSKFDDATITRMLGHVQTLLEAIVADPSRRLCELPLMTDAEQHRLLVDRNATRRDYPEDACLHVLFERQAQRSADAVAVVFEDECLTYGELNRRANQLAHHLQGLGVQRETLVGLYVERSLEMVVGMLGILKAGAAYVPLDAGHPQERLAFILHDARIAVVLTQSRLAAGLPADWPPVLRLDADWPAVAAHGEANLPPCAKPQNLAYVIYTSGSTGKPKGVLVEHRQILNYVQGITERYQLEAGASFAMVQPLSVDSSQTVIFPALVSGGCLHVVSEARAADPEALREYFSRHPADLLKIAPSHLAALQPSLRPEPLLPRRWLVIGGEVSRRDWVETLQAMTSCAIFNHYGPTEATVGALTHPVTPEPGHHASATVPIGRPLPNAVAYVLDRYLQPVPIGVPGELHIGGRCLARGYLNRPELTAERFIADPFRDTPGARVYKTGDLARHLPDGNIEFLGRIDDQVKIRGFRVEPAEIESALNGHPGVRESVVVASEDDPRSMRLIACIVPTQRSSPTTADLRDFLRQRLPDYMVPSAFVLLDALPRTSHGKLDRRALPAAVGAGFDSGNASVEPRDPIETTLAGIWTRLLRVPRISVHDNFFDCGGHSLLAIQVVSRVCETFRVEIPVRSLFERPTIAALAEIIRQAQDGGGDIAPKAMPSTYGDLRRTKPPA